MQKGNLTRAQAVEQVGAIAVDAVDATNCEPTGRVGYNGAAQENSLTEWSASVACEGSDGCDCTLVAYYYTSNDDDAAMAESGDGSAITWTIRGYEIA